MNFIFPQNYDFNTKLFGFIDYNTIIINIIWDIFIIFISKIIFNNLNIIIFISIIFCFPLLLFSVVGLNGENIFYILKYIIKYLFKPKIYLYTKQKYHIK